MRLVLLLFGATSIGYCGSLDLNGLPFRPSAPITWAVTNHLPNSIWVLKSVPRPFSEIAISNAMAIGSFSPLNRIKSEEKGLLHFQDNRDKTYMTRYLKMSPLNGAISYYNGRADGKKIENVPTFEQAEKLAMDYFRRLGADTNQVLSKPISRTESTTRSLDKKTGREGQPTVKGRGIMLYRQIHGIEISGSWFHIEFVTDAKIPTLEMHWRNFEDARSYPVANANQLMQWVKAGMAVNPSPVPIPIEEINRAQKLTITKVTPYYLGDPHNQPQEFVYPFAEIEMVAENGNSKTTFRLHCPIIETKSAK